ncbi:hypothetical protein [Prosthecobacter sp.]|uniref:hypothetical protein n=1 Tax=Prosthecobacter sp. TaxID=1965333 RepID=UPI001D45A09C|nr:hypothetical protein [Prosthecobacter sp.]MCB1278184.1 hypothetical protein [Prosthecobacter sp.]
MTSLIAKSVTVLAACAALNASAGTPAKAPVMPVTEPETLFDSVGADLSVAYDSRYYFRGLWFADNIISSFINLSIPVIGGAAEDGAGSLTWGLGGGYISSLQTPFQNAAGVNTRNGFDYSEYDLYTSLSYDVGFATLGVQYQYYGYPDTYSGTFNGVSNAAGDAELGLTGAHEVGVTLAIPLGAFNFSTGYYYDLTINGQYFQVAADYTYAVNDWLSIVPAIQAGYGIDYYTGTRGPTFAGVATQSSGFTHVLFSIATPIQLTKIATLTPYVAWNFAGSTRNYMNATHDNEMFGGVKLSVSF